MSLLQVAVPEELDQQEEFNLMSKLQGLRPGSRRCAAAACLLDLMEWVQALACAPLL